MQSELNGIIVLNKPAGISSAHALAKVKKLLEASKAGHAGTLDPFATGLLICCINRATRLARFFLQSDKRYEAVLRLGIETDTQDATGQIIARSPVPTVSVSDLQAIFKRFEGKQMQHPPVYAALKHEGRPLYKLAREGRPVQKPARPVTITAMRVMAVQLPDIRFEMTCSAGTYVRTLCADIGRVVGCGGHLATLRRTAAGGFTVDEAVSLEALNAMDRKARQKQIVAMAAALRHMPAFTTNGPVLQHMAHGRRLTRDQVPATAIAQPTPGALSDYVKVLDGANNLRAVLQPAPDGNTYNYCCVFH